MVYTSRDLLAFGALSIAWHSKEHTKTHFGNWIYFRPHLMGGKPLSMEADPVSETWCSCSLEYRTTDKVQKLSNPEPNCLRLAMKQSTVLF
jgi:hypothetical protein